MQSIVIKHNDKLVTSLQQIADNTSSDVVSMQRLIRTHSSDLEKFGNINFDEEMVKGKTGSTKKKLYYLNEQQSYLFITFMKNTDIVKQFKIALIQEFFKMKDIVNVKPNTQEIELLQQTILEQNRLLAQQTPSKEIEKIRRDNTNLQRALIDFSNRYHNIVLKAESIEKAVKKELKAMTCIFQTLPSIKENSTTNLNTDTVAKLSHWS